MCSAFRQIQGLIFGKMSSEDVEEVVSYEKRHSEFCAKLYKRQHENVFDFLHEHPWGASSWQRSCVGELLYTEGISRVKSHMCAFGIIDSDRHGGRLVKKPIGFMTNAILISQELSKPCSGDHRHVVVLGGVRARRPQVYPGELCKANIFGLSNQMLYDVRL